MWDTDTGEVVCDNPACAKRAVPDDGEHPPPDGWVEITVWHGTSGWDLAICCGVECARLALASIAAERLNTQQLLARLMG
jgi:hypothetical protein